MSGTHNILVISDLHLGEDLTAAASPETTRDLRRAEAQLVEFLDKYTRRRADGKPWRLIINGDMVDFLGICVFPRELADAGGAGSGYTPDEYEYGTGRRRSAALARIAAVLGHHSAFFQALARFVAAGNAVVILGGNHDTELHWPEVREALRQGVVSAWLDTVESQRTGADTAEEIATRVQFHEWFYYEPGVVWIEHGHQYDECCSYQYNLAPVDERDESIMTNVDTAAMRHLIGPFAEASPHGTEQWSFIGFVRLGFSQGPSMAMRMARGYYRFAASLMSQWRRTRISRSRHGRRAAHKRALDNLAQASPLSEADLLALDALQRRPVVSNLKRLLQVLMLDKILIWSAVIMIVALAIATLPLWAFLPVAMGSVVGADRLGKALARGRMVDPSLPLSIVPARIVERVDARYVIFGHTHLPVARRIEPRASAARDQGALGEERWYFNTGTWVPTGKQGLFGSFTHVIIRSLPSGQVDAQLCQWRDGASWSFDPDQVLGVSGVRAPGVLGAPAPLPERPAPSAAAAIVPAVHDAHAVMAATPPAPAAGDVAA